MTLNKEISKFSKIGIKYKWNHNDATKPVVYCEYNLINDNFDFINGSNGLILGMPYANTTSNPICMFRLITMNSSDTTKLYFTVGYSGGYPNSVSSSDALIIPLEIYGIVD